MEKHTNISKLPINNQHNNTHRLRHPRNFQQHQHLVKQINPNHQHAFHFRKILIHLKKDIRYYHNL